MMQHPSATPTATAMRSLRPLLSTCAMAIALAAAASGGKARAQAFQGTGTVVAGSVNQSDSGAQSVFTLRTPTAVINWAPTDTAAGSGAINFLPAGNTATFQAAGDFTVLNRIVPTGGASTRAVGLNGSVIGQIGLRAPQTGGNIWFYSPTGIVTGNGSSFTAGGLIFAADDIVYSPDPTTGDPNFTATGAIQFRGALGSQSSVTIMPGTSITASAASGNAYVALVAPRVEQAGLIQLDGSAAMVAAEAADITINQGLFDIRMVTGTTVPDAITHTGTTGRPASATYTGAQKVYFAALPKNTAITMLLSGNIGASLTASPGSNRSVILSGGYDILDNSFGAINSVADAAGAPANVQIVTGAATPTVFSAALTGHATGTITANPERGQSIIFSENTSLTGDAGVALTADLDESLIARQDLDLISPVSAGIALHTTNATAGTGTNPATLNVANNLLINTNNTGNGSVGDATGGTAYLQLDAGAVGPVATVGATTTIEADGTGGSTDSAGGSGFGGTAQLLMNGGTLTLHDTLIHANGSGASSSSAGGDAVGGTAEFVGNGGKSTLGALSITADAEGGASFGSTDGNADDSSALARVVSSGAGTELHVDSLSLSASATGDVGGGTAQTSQGGTVDIAVANGGLLASNSQIEGFASAGWQLFSALSTSAGVTTGGTITANIAGGTLTAPGAQFSTDAQALASDGAQGDTTGGNITFSVTDQGTNEGVATLTSDLVMSANGYGGDGSSGGNAQGGAVNLHVDGGTLNLGTNAIQIDAASDAGLAPAASATGGDVVITTKAGGGQAGLTFGALTVDVSGNAEVNAVEVGPLSAGDGGLGRGGAVTITASGASLAGDTINANLEGIGGDAALTSSAPLFTAGNGQGGTFGLTVNGGAVNVNTITVDAVGFGGMALGADTSDSAGIPGNGFGGSATITATSGSFTNQAFSFDASGQGGAASEGGSVGSPSGGSGQGGTAALVLGAASFTTLGGSLTANGTGTDGSKFSQTPGGSGTGGTASITATDAQSYSLGDVSLTADGAAGNSSGTAVAGDGTGTGGTAKFINQGATNATVGSRTVGALTLEADGKAGAVGGAPGTRSVAGVVQLSDLATGTNGKVHATSVDATAQGIAAPAGNGALIESSTNPLLVDTHFNVTTAGTIVVNATGKGTIAAGGAVTFQSVLGDIDITHTGQTTPPTPTITGGAMTFDAAGNVNAGAGTFISASDSLLVRARTGDIAVDTLAAVNSIDLHALGSVSLNNLTTTGPTFTGSGGGGSIIGGSIYITAGIDPLTLAGVYLPGDITINGDVSASGQLLAHAGQDILDAPSLLEGKVVQLIAERDINGPELSIVSHGDFDVHVGRNLRANTVDVTGAVNTIDNLGNITQAGKLIVPGTLDIDNFILRGAAAGVLQSGGDLTLGTAQANGGLDVTSQTGLLTIGSLGGFPTGASSFLTANAPAIKLTNIATSGDITGTASATTLDATGLNAGGAVSLSAKTALTPTNVTAGGSISLTSSTGPINAQTLTGQSIGASAATTLSLTGATATAGGITTTSAGLLTLGNDTATADILGTSTAGAVDATGLTAGGAVLLTADTALAAANVTAGGAASLTSNTSAIDAQTVQAQGITATAATTLSLTGSSATAGGITTTSTGLLTLASDSASAGIIGTSTAGGITATDLNAGGGVNLNANQALSGNRITAGGAVSLTSTTASIAGATIKGKTIDAHAPTTLSLTGSTTTGGDLTARSGGLLTLTNDQASGGITGASTGDAVSAAGLAAGGAVALNASAALGANGVTAGGAVTLASSTGDITGQNITATTFTATTPGAIGLDTVSTTVGDLKATAGGALTANALAAAGAATLASSGSSIAGTAVQGRTIDANAATTLSLTGSTTTAGDLTARSSGLLTLGNDGASGGITGSSTGSTVSASGLAAGGAIALGARANVNANGVTAGGPVTLTSNNGDIIGKAVRATAFTATAPGTIGLDTVTATAGDLDATAGGALTANALAATGAVKLTSAASSITGTTVQGGTVDATAATTLSLSGSTATGGDITARSAGLLALGNDRASGGITGASTGNGLIASGLTAGGLVSLNASSNLNANSIAAGGSVTLTSSNGGIAGATISGKTIAANAPTTISLTGGAATGGDLTARSGGLLTLANDSASGSITGASTGDAASTSGLTAGGAVALTAVGPISANGLTAGGQASLTSSNGDITGTGIQSQDFVATSPGAIGLGSATATNGDIAANGGGAVGLQDGRASNAISLFSNTSTVAIGSAEAGGELNVRALGAVTVDGTATGATIQIGSDDIVIGSEASVGTAGRTTTIDLINNDSGRRSFFGGADQPSGYSLNTNEASRLYAGDITLIAPATAQSSDTTPDVVVGALSLSSRSNDPSGQIGPQGAFTIQTDGRLLIDGAVTMTGAGNGDTFAIDAGNLIMLDNQRGLIDLQGPNGALGGTIALSADRIMAVSSAAATALATLSDPVAIDARLSINDGSVNDGGVLRANALRFTVGDGLYIQNTGAGAAFGLRRGFLAGLGSITINAAADATPLIVINGVVDDAPEFGLDTIPLVTINGLPAPSATGYVAGSTINGCVFANLAACRQPPGPVVPNRDTIVDPLNPPQLITDQHPAIDKVEIEEIGRFDYEPLIDEPVTGSGNDDLWTQDCDPSSQQPCSRPPIDTAPGDKKP